MKIPHKKFCVLPWISLETSPIGTVRPCCLAEDEIVDDSGKKFDLNHAGFADIQNSQHMIRLRQEFQAGLQPETCKKCWSEEDAGRTSKRMHTLDRLKHLPLERLWTDEAMPLMFLDLKLGNICNLKCRICGSWSSSTYAAEELKHTSDPKNSYHYTMMRAGAWPRENPTFWREIEQVIDHVRYIEFTGGEPFMISEHFDLLLNLIQRGLAQNIEIHYNTNGTQWPELAEDIWRHFKTVEIAFSIDDVGTRFEYQRSNAVWKEVNNNLQKFRYLKQRNPNIQLQVCCTVNVFNVLYLADVANWIDQQGFDFVYWNMMHQAEYFSIGTLPNSVKQVIADRLGQAQVSHRQEFDRICDFMMNGISTDGTELRKQIAQVDQRRGQNFAAVEPEMAALIGYAGP